MLGPGGVRQGRDQQRRIPKYMPEPSLALGDVDRGGASDVDAGSALSLNKTQQRMQPPHREFGFVVGGDGGAEQTDV